jgi:hypothetical protein
MPVLPKKKVFEKASQRGGDKSESISYLQPFRLRCGYFFAGKNSLKYHKFMGSFELKK